MRPTRFAENTSNLQFCSSSFGGTVRVHYFSTIHFFFPRTFLAAERLSSVGQDCCYTGQSPDVLTVFGLDSLQQVQSKGSIGWHGESGGESLTLSV